MLTLYVVLKAETETCMRLLGVDRVEQLGMQHVSSTTPGMWNTTTMPRNIPTSGGSPIINPASAYISQQVETPTNLYQINARAVERDIYDGPAALEKPSLADRLRAKL
jgi:L-lactate dehydrogenase (cytochrome)